MLRGVAILAGLLLCPWALAAQEVGDVLSGPAEAVAADTVRLRGQELRLYGIAALEGAGPPGGAGAARLAEVLAGRPLTCTVVALHGCTPDPRREAVCKVGGAQGSDIAAIMVDAGWAAVESAPGLRRIRPELIKGYVRLEVEARAACLGLWRQLPECARQSRP